MVEILYDKSSGLIELVFAYVFLIFLTILPSMAKRFKIMSLEKWLGFT